MKSCEGPGCGNEFAARGRKRFCSDRCRFRAHVAPKVSRPRASRRKRIQSATLRELRAARRQDSASGLVALELAEALDRGGESGAALAALAREYSSALERALRSARPDDPVQSQQDEVAKRRERRRADAG